MGVIRVKALKTGYIYNQRFREGDVFMVNEEEVSFDRVIKVKDKRTKEIIVRNHKGWMKKVDDSTPLTEKKRQKDPYSRTPLSHELDVV